MPASNHSVMFERLRILRYAADTYVRYVSLHRRIAIAAHLILLLCLSILRSQEHGIQPGNMTTIGARFALAYRQAVSGHCTCTAAVRSTPVQVAGCISTSSAPSFCAAAAAPAHPNVPVDEDVGVPRPTIGARNDPVAERSSAQLQAMVASKLHPEDRRRNGPVAERSSAPLQATVASKLHPEDRLKAARRKMLKSMGLTVDGDGKVVEPREVLVTPTATAINATNADTTAQLPICAQNNHPDYRLRLARERVLAKVRGVAGADDDVGVDAGNDSARSLSSTRIDLDMSPDRRLSLARTEQAARPLQRFPPLKRKKRRPKTGAVLSRLNSQQPPLLRNDGFSSGAVASIRLREARQSAIEVLNSPPPSSSSSSS